MRQPIIAGNWKMNNTIADTKVLLADLIPLVKGAKAECIVCVPYTNIQTAGELIKGTNIKLGAENVHWADKGAFTGEISADMLLELGVEYVIIGHSERRQFFGETDETVNKRSITCLAKGLKPIICVGESLEERQSGAYTAILEAQTEKALVGIDKSELGNLVIAYEPIWAIGTGVTATNQEANDTIAIIRNKIASLYCRNCADNVVRIQYGGSMNPKNVADLMAMPEIDGGLIGGASLNASDFSKVVKY